MVAIIVIGAIVVVVVLVIWYVASQPEESSEGYNSRVQITQQGKGGQIRYSDDGTALSFFWEYSMEGGAIIMVPGEGAWEDYCNKRGAEWAKDRRQGIITTISTEFKRQRLPKTKGVTVVDSDVYPKG